MSLHILTVCHMEPEIVAWSIMRFRRTTNLRPDTWSFLDNCWPIGKDTVFSLLSDIAPLSNPKMHYSLSRAEKNLGGHGGVNRLLEEGAGHIRPQDLVLIYDPDSNPVSIGWLEAMVEVMDKDPSMAYVSLLPQSLTDRPWAYDSVSGHKVAFLSQPEWWNVTLFRASILDKGFQSDAEQWGAKFYGHVEPPMFRYAKEKGMRSGYMFEYREEPCPIPHPKAYTRWKQEHAYGKFSGNFDQYCVELNIT